MRAAQVIFGLATLFWGFTQAPFNHIHAEDLDHRDIPGVTHIHGSHHDDDHGVAIEARTADDDELDVNWTISFPMAVSIDIDLESTDRPEIPSPVAVAGSVPEAHLHGHDPPSEKSSNPRGPPA